jgi:hypothetical protein
MREGSAAAARQHRFQHVVAPDKMVEERGRRMPCADLVSLVMAMECPNSASSG